MEELENLRYLIKLSKVQNKNLKKLRRKEKDYISSESEFESDYFDDEIIDSYNE
jgi:hypothetical protein